jgi:phosphomannomutase
MEESLEQILRFPAVALFDLDGTLSEGGKPLSETMLKKIEILMKRAPIAIISGASFERIEKSVLAPLSKQVNSGNCYVFSNGGSMCHLFDGNEWKLEYQHTLSDTDKILIQERVSECVNNVTNSNEFGKYHLVMRDSKVVFSALSDDSSDEAIRAWVGDGTKLSSLKRSLESYLPQFEIHLGSTRSLDITPKGIDKGHAIEWLSKHLGKEPKQMLFVGDGFFRDGEGNDRPVVATGVRAMRTNGPASTERILDKLLQL